MRWTRTLSLYVTREVLQYTALGLAAITILMVTRSLMRVLDELIGAGFLIGDLLAIMGLLGTMLLIYALPVSFLFGVLLAIGRMASDVEITAMRACGIGLRGLLLPILGLGLLLSALTFELTLEVEPKARHEMSNRVRQLLVRGASVEAGRFNMVGDRTLYVDERDRDGGLRGIVISDRSNPERPYLVFAEAGRMMLDEASEELTLLLERGDVHMDLRRSGEDRYQRIGFERFEYTINVTQAMGPVKLLRPRQMELAQLRATVATIARGEDPGPLREEPAAYGAHLQRRYAMPWSPALFALVGVPLGIRRTGSARAYGVILCALLAFGYYALVSFCDLLATESGFPPFPTLWLPNALFLALGVGLLIHARRAT